MINYHELVKSRPEIFNQLTCKELLFVHYKCPVEKPFTDSWSHYNYIQFILSGKKGFHGIGRSFYLTTWEGIFVRKGACILEKFFEEPLCIITFFIPDPYLKSFLKENKILPATREISEYRNNPLVPLHVNEILIAYIESVIPYFYADQKPPEELLELKFRELLLTILTDPGNNELRNYLQDFASPEYDPFQQVMEANCIFNLTLADYARLLNMSLSSFKRRFHSVYKTNPGQWLLDQKLNYSHRLLVSTNKPIADISFESGFEDSTHFSHAFKKRFGVSPLKYRKDISTTELVAK